MLPKILEFGECKGSEKILLDEVHSHDSHDVLHTTIAFAYV
jgi:hypothetical protein